MKNYPERYYELLSTRDVLKDDIEFMEKVGLKNVSKLVDVQIYLAKIEAEIEQIEKEYNIKEFYMITKEIYDKTKDEEYHITVGEFYDEETAVKAFKEELTWLTITEFDENYAVREEPGFAAVEDKDTLIVLFLIKIEIDEEI